MTPGTIGLVGSLQPAVKKTTVVSRLPRFRHRRIDDTRCGKQDGQATEWTPRKNRPGRSRKMKLMHVAWIICNFD
jgi:hypothetical protein